MTFLHPFDDAEVIAGQGTIGLEILEQVPNLEAVVVPIGGGGLIGGVACAIKESNARRSASSACRPSGCLRCCARARQASRSRFRRRRRLPMALPCAARASARCALVERYVDEMVTVDEEEIASAILVLLEREKTLAEGAGAAALAAVLQRKTSLTAERTAVLVCGGNIDVSLLAKIIERGLVKDGRWMRLRIHLSDRPGALHQLTQDHRRPLGEHRADAVRPRLLRREPGRHGDRLHAGDPRG